MLKNLVHDQIKILLERMDTHPEEFLREGKWDTFLPPETGTRVMHSNFKQFTKLEQYIVRQAYKKLVKATLRQRAYDSILETLVFKEEEPRTKERYLSTSNHAVLGTPSYTVSTIKEHLDAHVKAVVKEWGKD